MKIRFVGRKNLAVKTAWFFLANSIIFWIIGYSFLRNILLSPSLFENSIIHYTRIWQKALVILFAIVNYLSYMAALAFVPAIMVFVFIVCIPNKKIIMSLSILSASCGLFFLLVDTQIYSMFKFHLGWPVIEMIIRGQWMDFFDFSIKEVLEIILTLLIIIGIETFIAFYVWKKAYIPQGIPSGTTIVTLWLGSFLFSYFTLLQSIAINNNLFSQQTPNLPFYNQIMAYLVPDKKAADVLYRYSEEHFSLPLYSSDPMKYPIHNLKCEPPLYPYNIILIMVDSLRADSLQEKYMPHLYHFAKENWLFKKHISGGNATQAGLFSLFYSIPVNYWTAALEQKIPPVFLTILEQYRYHAEVLWSSEWLNPPFHKTIYLGIKNLGSSVGDDIGTRDKALSQKAIRFLEHNNSKRPFFLNLFYDAPHGYCREQNYPKPFQPAIKTCSRLVMNNDMDPKPYYNRYLNSVSFVDSQIGEVLSTINKLGYLKNSIVIITSDHGQEFNDNQQNYWGHAGNYTNQQVQIPLVIHWPEKASRIIEYQTSSYDLVPTLLKRLFQCQNPMHEYSIGQDLLLDEGRLPFVLSGSYTNMGIIESNHIITLRTSGVIAVTDLHAKPEPDVEPGSEILQSALQLMRRYFVH